MSYWEHRKPVQRHRAVDIAEIARVSVRLLDEGGLRALTLRAVAQQVEVAPASLYSRVESVDDLFDLALDTALADDPVMNESIRNADLSTLMHDFFSHLTAHRWAVRCEKKSCIRVDRSALRIDSFITGSSASAVSRARSNKSSTDSTREYKLAGATSTCCATALRVSALNPPSSSSLTETLAISAMSTARWRCTGFRCSQ